MSYQGCAAEVDARAVYGVEMIFHSYTNFVGFRFKFAIKVTCVEIWPAFAFACIIR